MATTGTSADAIEMIEADHRGVEQLFSQLRAATEPTTRLHIGERIIEELSVHAAIEEQIVYPAARRGLGHEVVGHSIDEHERLKQVLDKLDGLSPEDDEFTSGFAEAERIVADHVAEEEGALLPRLREYAGQGRIQKMGTAMAAARKLAPTHPHPRMPSTPPGNLVLGPLVAIADRVRDAARRDNAPD